MWTRARQRVEIHRERGYQRLTHRWPFPRSPRCKAARRSIARRRDHIPFGRVSAHDDFPVPRAGGRRSSRRERPGRSSSMAARSPACPEWPRGGFPLGGSPQGFFGKRLNDCSISLILGTRGRIFLTSRSFFEPRIFLMMNPIMLTSEISGQRRYGKRVGASKILKDSNGNCRSLSLGDSRTVFACVVRLDEGTIRLVNLERVSHVSHIVKGAE